VIDYYSSLNVEAIRRANSCNMECLYLLVTISTLIIGSLTCLKYICINYACIININTSEHDHRSNYSNKWDWC